MPRDAEASEDPHFCRGEATIVLRLGAQAEAEAAVEAGIDGPASLTSPMAEVNGVVLAL